MLRFFLSGYLCFYTVKLSKSHAEKTFMFARLFEFTPFTINWRSITNTVFLLATLLRTLYLNNRVFLSRNYRLIVAPRKFDALKTNIFSTFLDESR